jgi:CubicO group peptidase (beta-lactamase class C family)
MQSLKWILIGLATIFALFLAKEWWQSFPRVNLAPPISVKNQQDKLDSILIQTINEHHLAGLAVGIISNSQVLYKNTLGYESLEKKDSLTSQSKIHVASISKIFLALYLSSYLQENGLNILDSIKSLSPELNSKYPEIGELSFSQILRHQSGLRDASFFSGFFRKKNTPNLQDFVWSQLPKQLNRKGDLSYNYADFNYELLGYLLEKDSGLSYDNLLNRWLSEDLDLQNSYFKGNSQEENPVVMGYRKTYVWKRLKPHPFTYQVSPYPSSGMISTLDDLIKVTTQLIRADLGMLKSNVQALEVNEKESWAGFQQIAVGEESNWMGHFGGQAGYSSLLIFDPGKEFGIIILSNTRDQGNFRIDLARKIIKILEV